MPRIRQETWLKNQDVLFFIRDRSLRGKSPNRTSQAQNLNFKMQNQRCSTQDTESKNLLGIRVEGLARPELQNKVSRITKINAKISKNQRGQKQKSNRENCGEEILQET